MRILLTGATGYIGKRLLPALLEQGHEIIACVRDPNRFPIRNEWKGRVEVFQVDLLEPIDQEQAPKDIDAAYYLIHSMTSSIGGFEEKEALTARHFREYIEQTTAKQIIYLSGINSSDDKLSKHLKSRYQVEQILTDSTVPLTTIRAGIIIGSGSASFEIIRDLVEKLPLMVAPRWLDSKCQPIGIRNVLQILTGILLKPKFYNQSYDVGCGEIWTYKEMLLGYAEVRQLKRAIFTLPIMTPRLSSYWLYFITSTSYNLAVNLVDSMKVNVVGTPNDLHEQLGIALIPYKKAVELAFSIIEEKAIVSSWKDSYVSSLGTSSLQEYIKVPEFGSFKDFKVKDIEHNSVEQVLNNIWSIGGERGWYYASFLWKIRGYLDKLVGGIGLRRGRTHPERLSPGDALDFWRVLVADREEKRLLLFAEMKLPGEAWLEFRIKEKEDGTHQLLQTATFRPKGIWGRAYWYVVLPFHFFVFEGMISSMEAYQPD